MHNQNTLVLTCHTSMIMCTSSRHERDATDPIYAWYIFRESLSSQKNNCLQLDQGFGTGATFCTFCIHVYKTPQKFISFVWNKKFKKIHGAKSFHQGLSEPSGLVILNRIIFKVSLMCCLIYMLMYSAICLHVLMWFV